MQRCGPLPGGGERVHLAVLAGNFSLRSAQAYAVAGHSLGSIAVVCAVNNRRWGYDQVTRSPCWMSIAGRLRRCLGRTPPACRPALLQVVDLLLKLYKFPQFSITRPLLHGTVQPPPGAAAALKASPGGGQERITPRRDPSVPIGGCASGRGPSPALSCPRSTLDECHAHRAHTCSWAVPRRAGRGVAARGQGRGRRLPGLPQGPAHAPAQAVHGCGPRFSGRTHV